MIPSRRYVVPEVLEVHVVPSEEVRIVPLSPTATNNPLEVVWVVLLSSLLLQEMTVKLQRNMERMISRFFTWVPFGSLGEPNIYHQSVCFTRKWEDCGGCLTVKH